MRVRVTSEELSFLIVRIDGPDLETCPIGVGCRIKIYFFL